MPTWAKIILYLRIENLINHTLSRGTYPDLPTPVTCKSGGFENKSRKTWRLGPQTWRFSKYVSNNKKSIICLRVFLFYLFSAPCCTLLHSRVLDNEQPSWFVFEAKLPQKPLRTNVSLEWGWHLHCTQFSLTNRLITLIRLLRTQIVCYSFIFSSLCRIFLGNFEVFGSPWDLKAKPWDREMASQTVSVTVKPWELEGLIIST